MKVLGIISEYNPFHYGHKYHIEKSKALTNCDYTVAIMSGCSVQRGEFAIIEQHRRAKTAIENGVDLVLELPVCYSSQSAEIFSLGSINILNRLNFVDAICCGSETKNLQDINQIVPIISNENQAYKNLLKKHLDTGISFPTARSLSLKELTGIDIGKGPNDTLALEYAKALYRLNSPIKLHTIKRQGENYNSSNLGQGFASATGIRDAFQQNTLTEELLPITSFQSLVSYGKIINTFPILKPLIIREGQKIKNIFDINEGIENSIIKNIKKAQTKEELIHLIKSKRYTHTRISRMLHNILLGIEKEPMTKIINSTEAPYAKILALNSKGKELITKTNKENITLINKTASFTEENELQKILHHYDTIANEMYLSLSKEKYISQTQISPVVM